MDWTEIQLTVATADAELAQAIATMTVPYGFYVEDYADMEQTLPEIGWVDVIAQELLDKDREHAVIHIYIPQNANPEEAVAFLRQRLCAEQIAYTIKAQTVSEADWENNWKQYYKPERVGARLVVCPSWEQYAAKPDDVVLTLDPGSAFGTGQHETTQLCMELLEQTIRPGMKLLDMGTGSGILSIAALKLGAATAAIVDIDPNAVTTACRNARENGFGADVFVPFVGNVVHDEQLSQRIGGGYDLIVANIVADIIIAMRDVFSQKLQPGAPLLVSGIIDARAQEVAQALAQSGLRLVAKRELRGWVAMHLQKDANG